MGLWSTRTVSEIHFIPFSMTPVPGPVSAPWRAAFNASKRHSCTSVDLPEPDTPLRQVIIPNGMSISTFFRLCLAAFRNLRILGLDVRRFLGTGTFNSPMRYLPVSELEQFSSPAIVPE